MNGGGLAQFFVTSRGAVLDACVRERLRRSLVGLFFQLSGIMLLAALTRACDCVGGEPSQAPVVLLVARQLQLVQFGACLCVRQPLPTPPAVSWDIAGRLW